LNKADLIKMVATNANVDATTAKNCVDAVLSSVTDAVVGGDSVSLVGFGRFFAKERGARVARNPKTGETINLPASRAPAFRPGKVFKEAVNA